MVFCSLIRTFADDMKKFLLLCLVLSVESLVFAYRAVPQSGDWRMFTRLDSLVRADSLLVTTQLGLMVWDLTDDREVYAWNSQQLMRPASTMKVLTAVTALDRLGGDYELRTSIYIRGEVKGGVLTGDLVCVGGMDPMFGRDDLRAIVGELKRQGVKTLRGNIVTDNTMKESEKWGEGWCWDDKNPTLAPLLAGGKADFGEQLLQALKDGRIVVAGVRVVPGSGKGERGALLCTRSHKLSEVLVRMMKESDNLFAESVFYQVAASMGRRPATARDGREAEVALLDSAGLDGRSYRIADGSGLSLYNYLSAEAETMVLRYAWRKRAIYDWLLPTLPVAAVDGTLKKRMLGTAAAGNVKAKTGTVSGVIALAGYCMSAQGHQLCFAILNQGIMRAADARTFQDKVCVILREGSTSAS